MSTYDYLKMVYSWGYLEDDFIYQNAVDGKITAEEFKDITGKDFATFKKTSTD
ncbi:hypothetical protein IV37_GL000201 [Fructilactobacillus fructivorans]|uniref:XkdX family protein n=1 Tax=Fructilactobacillus fructivorans TaxID=1614 RepID=UPI0007135D02|nr:XkdX family protein [Fructilactobacillus fructivorans]KRN13479.1 hypothetical protein IV37_GL000201 [Fructilactobacillus fructivorans]